MPDDLYAELRAKLPDELSWSRELRHALVARLECDHPALRCTRCGVTVDVEEGVEVDPGEPEEAPEEAPEATNVRTLVRTGAAGGP